ncbi:MAG: response regulator [Chloroflexia bacterium]|nr:response regulator [Chloroflexia bacterium]
MKKKILVADDEPDVLFMTAFSLRTVGGFEVIEARNGLEAVERAKETQPDVIVLDIKMPRMNGYEACAKLKQDPALQDVPVIFLSAKGQRQEIQQGMDLGAAAYILKPFAPEVLISKVRELL